MRIDYTINRCVYLDGSNYTRRLESERYCNLFIEVNWKLENLER